MNSPVLGLRIAGVIFGLMALLHLLRLTMGWQIIFVGHLLPLWISVIGLVIAGMLSLWMWRLSRAVIK